MNATLTRQLDRARQELLSLLSRDQMPADPVVLAEALGLQPDEWQRDVLRSTASRMLLNCCRQSGKSTTTAICALHTALYVPESLVLMVSPGLRQSGELFKKALAFYRRLGRPVPAECETRLQLELTNGSRIISLPGSETTTRGYSAVSLLLADEASRIPDEMLASLRPMLAVSGGRLIAMSTPAGKRGWWFSAWSEGGDAWQRVRVPAVDCPRISPAFLEDERRSLGQQVYAAEYECTFTDALDSVFRTDDILAALDHSVLPLFPTAPSPEATRVLIA